MAYPPPLSPGLLLPGGAPLEEGFLSLEEETQEVIGCNTMTKQSLEGIEA